MTADGSPEVELVPVSPEAAGAISAGAPPPGVSVPEDYPSEFSAGVAGSVGQDGMVGPFFIRRRADALIVGELGGAFTDESAIEVGYAVVDSLAGRGYATAAVKEFLKVARGQPAARRVVAHTPPDRPASSRVLAKAGFRSRGQVEDEHEGQVITVEEWEFAFG